MKRQNKSFVVEVKRQRRPEKLAILEPMATEPRKLDTFVSSVTDLDVDFHVPAFLQTGQPQSPGLASAPDLFTAFAKPDASAPQPPAFAAPQAEAAKPRILPSLMEPPAPELLPEPEIRTRSTRRKTETQQDTHARNVRVQDTGDMETDVLASAKTTTPADRPKIAAKISPARKVRSIVPSRHVFSAETTTSAGQPATAIRRETRAPEATAYSEAHSFETVESARKTRSWRNRHSDAAHLPPGQRWKRRLHPAAW